MLGLGNTLSGGVIPAAAVSAFVNTKSIDFDGTNDHIIFGDVTWGYGTLSLWFKTPNESSVPLTIGSGQFVYLANKIYINWPKHDGYLTFDYDDYDDDAWHHLVCTFNESAAKMYYDGSLVVNSTGLAEASTTGALWFGKYGGGGLQFEGNLDEISWWNNTTLELAAVEQIYNSGAPIDLSSDSGNYTSSSALTHWWRMGDGDTYDTINDNVGDLDGTMTFMASDDLVTEVPSA